MAWVRPPRLQSEYALRFIRQVAGSSKPAVVLLAVFFILTTGISGNAAWGILLRVATSPPPEAFSWLAHLAGLSAFPFLLVILWLSSRRAREGVRVSVIQDSTPPQVRALILFLSPPGPKDKPLIDEILEGKTLYRLTDPAHRAKFLGSWRMPLEALAYHLVRLKTVVLIASQDSDKSAGTWRDVETFREVTKRLIGPGKETSLQILDLPGLFQEAAKKHKEELARQRSEGRRWAALVQHVLDPQRRWPLWQRIADSWGTESVEPVGDYARGVNFEDARQLADAVELAHECLRICEIPAYDILIDVTGGQKPSTVAGAAVSLAEGRRFQYVSTHDYSVLTYDVTYLA